MGGIGIWQILIVAALVLLLFGGRGKISSVMGDLAKGITSFRKGLKDGEAEPKAEPKPIPDQHETIDATAKATPEAEPAKTAER